LTREHPVIALGTGPHAEEDRRVLEAAVYARADYLVTYNVKDFLSVASPHPVTGHPTILGVQIVQPHDLAQKLGWPLEAPPPPTVMPPNPPSTGARTRE